MERHFVGDMLHKVYTGEEVDAIPSQVIENAIFNLHEDTRIHAVLEGIHPNGFELLGLCYQEHADSPFVTRIRVMLEGEKQACVIDCPTVEEAIVGFNSILSDCRTGHVLSPDKNRGRYKAFCRMCCCRPLDRTG